MTEETTEEVTEEQNTEKIAVGLDTPDAVAYDELVDKFGEELILSDVREVVKNRVRSLYDSQEQIKQRLAQAQQQAAQQR